jgi:hypothetical protein
MTGSSEIIIDTITNENFEEYKDHLQNAVRKKLISSIEFSNLEIDFRNCNIDKITLNNCTILSISNSNIKEMNLNNSIIDLISDSQITDFKFQREPDFDSKCNIQTIIRTNFNNFKIVDIELESTLFSDCNFDGRMIFKNIIAKYPYLEVKDYTQYYGFRFSRCTFASSLIFENFTGSLILNDSHLYGDFAMDGENIDKVTILRCNGNNLNIKNDIPDFRIINSGFDNFRKLIDHDNIIAIKGLFNKKVSYNIINSSIEIQNAYIDNIYISSERKKPLNLFHCYINKLTFEEYGVINIPLRIRDCIIKDLEVKAYTFNNSVDLTGTTFLNDVSFQDIIFNRYLQFQETTFSKNLIFSKITTLESASFCTLIAEKFTIHLSSLGNQ